MAHGYLGDGYGIDGQIDPDEGDHRNFTRGRERSSRDDDRDWRDRERGQGMFSGRDEDWSNDDDRWSNRGWRGESNQRWSGERWPERGQSDSYNRQSQDWSGQHRHSANPDDHYRSWRDRHMSELDRDYQDYCREREEEFHRNFDNWRREKYGNPQPLRTGMTQSGISHDPSGMTEAAEDMAPQTAKKPSPTADATLGTNSGRSRSRG